MNLQNLPSDVINSILDQIFVLKGMRLSTWKEMLPLLSVCKNLRQAAAMRIYRYVILEHRSARSFTKVLSNIEFIAQSPNSVYPRNMAISILGMPYEHRILHDVITVLGKTPVLWFQVSYLSIELEINHRIQGSADLQEKAVILENAKQLAQYLPAVTKLNICGDGHGSRNFTFLKALTELFSTQIQSFACLDYDVLAKRIRFDQLAKLHIKLHDSSLNEMPRICTDTIKEMVIYDLPPECTWQLFSRELNKDIEVPHLRQLRLEYIGQRNTSSLFSAKHKLHFPQLQSLELEGRAKCFPLLNMAVLPQN
ncbi:hypothetical protein BX667DRAFT_494985, partial [Coemansia mojavensis]